ncbi:DUF262 domain-containing protein [Clostridium perfringens]|uniref:DUF262 domain-containing protein n=1 Tax=Clostridium perfringens TaxID=1502 RepID=UPI001CAAF87B|nr:DUF262 domain-containing protein [Clostridium perfringens]EIF6157013.1 DUF262 domain-containing protein [Clostridium perfringens]MDB2051931.1 DUF262 domain-containing protein [Clostridium perfringens]MDH2470486.1 DUF262 domain-containing protein [Clostridium perfringens]MDK0607932.1 DUF262 domain-containing protein [Clostridium perfringens]MDK0738810.1 DUF262 domain-containing protein [Clostridium perfringens]
MSVYSNLREELIEKRGAIYTNQLTMSVGEIINLYQNEEVNLEPAFQRLFRWNSFQETDFIESILLGYPIPAIFVLQREDGVWDVIDGVQRLSTIYHFVGILKEDNKEKEPLKLEEAKILNELKGKYYDNKKDSVKHVKDDECLDIATRIDFKRASFPVILLKHGSEKSSKYELFKRLNTGGSHLSDQEIRNALILMSDEEIYRKMEEYTKSDNFKSVLNLSDNKYEIRMEMDILTRFIIMRNYKGIEAKSNGIDINQFLDDEIKNIIESEKYDIDLDLKVLNILIKFLKEEIDEEYGFRKFDNIKDKFTGSFNWFIFETLIWGLTVENDIENVLLKHKSLIIDKIKNLKSVGEYQKENGLANLKVFQRLKEAKKEAKKVFDFNE